MAKRLGVPYATSMTWADRYRKGGEEALISPVRAQSKGSSHMAGRTAAILATKAEQPQAGTRRIRDVMRRMLGIGTSETTVRRVLHKHGAATPRPVPRAKPQRKVRRFERAEPNRRLPRQGDSLQLDSPAWFPLDM